MLAHLLYIYLKKGHPGSKRLKGLIKACKGAVIAKGGKRKKEKIFKKKDKREKSYKAIYNILHTTNNKLNIKIYFF